MKFIKEGMQLCAASMLGWAAVMQKDICECEIRRNF